MRKNTVIAVLGMITPTIVLAEPVSLSVTQLDSVTAGAPVSVAANAEALATGSQFAETITNAVTSAVSQSLGNVDLGVALGLSISNAAACCGAGTEIGVGTSANGSGDAGFGGNQSVSLGTNGGSASNFAVRSGNFK